MHGGAGHHCHGHGDSELGALLVAVSTILSAVTIPHGSYFCSDRPVCAGGESSGRDPPDPVPMGTGSSLNLFLI